MLLAAVHRLWCLLDMRLGAIIMGASNASLRQSLSLGQQFMPHVTLFIKATKLAPGKGTDADRQMHKGPTVSKLSEKCDAARLTNEPL